MKPTGPWALRADYAERNAIVVYDLLTRPTHFWVLDEKTQHLIALTKDEWLRRHPEVPGLLATLDADGRLGMTTGSTDCSRGDAPIATYEDRQPIPPRDRDSTADIKVSATTLAKDGIVSLPLNVGFGGFTVSLQSIGTVPHALEVSAVPSPAALPLGLSLCEIDPTTGQCRAPAGSAVKTELEAATLRTFMVFIKACSAIPLDLQLNRILVDFIDRDGKLLAATSVAVQTVP